MDIQRVAIVFDTTLRPETAGVYCQRARALRRGSAFSASRARAYAAHRLRSLPQYRRRTALSPARGLPAQRVSGRSIRTLILTAAARRRRGSTWCLLRSETALIYSEASACSPLHGCRWLVIPVFIASTMMWPSNTTSRSSGMFFRGRGPNCWESFSGDIGTRLLGSDTLRRWHVPIRFEEDFMWPDVIGRYWRPLLPRRVSAR